MKPCWVQEGGYQSLGNHGKGTVKGGEKEAVFLIDMEKLGSCAYFISTDDR